MARLGGALGPETRDVDMGTTPSETPAAEREPRFERAPAGASASPAQERVAMSREERLR